MTFLVIPAAEAQIRSQDSWWRSHRPYAPDLFLDELAAAVHLIRAQPEIGRLVPRQGRPHVRRVILRATRFHLYYELKYTARGRPSAVTVLAIWSAVRGRAPRLPRP